MISSACFDLECSSLNADFGIVLCCVIKPANCKKPIVLRGDDVCNWKQSRSDDSALVALISEWLCKYDILVAHNGQKFDLPFLRSRLERWGFPPFPKKKLVDPVLLARNNLKLSWNSLEKVSEHMRCPYKKSPVDGDHWLRASLDGDPESMDYIVDHCKRDVQILEWITERLKHYCSAFNSYGSGF